MSLLLHIGLGLGLAAAAGLRPFMPSLLAGALASGDLLGVDFDHHHAFAFLEASWFLLAVAAAFVLAYALQLRLGAERFEKGVAGACVGGLGIGMGALLFAGTLGDHGEAIWPGLVGGALCAALAQYALRPLLARARARLGDRAAREAVSVYGDAMSLTLAALVVLLEPVGFLAVLALAYLALVGRRRRGGGKYAGLRILR